MPDSLKEFNIKVDQFNFSLSREEAEAADIIPVGENMYHFLSGHRSIHANVIDTGRDSKSFSVDVEGEIFKIHIEDHLDQMLGQMGYDGAMNKLVKDIKAPMPGLVLEISVSEGETVTPGQKLLILEAMKMENSIVIQADATIRKIMVVPGQAVDKGQVMIELE